jgi:hypothetical protein
VNSEGAMWGRNGFSIKKWQWGMLGLLVVLWGTVIILHVISWIF